MSKEVLHVEVMALLDELRDRALAAVPPPTEGWWDFIAEPWDDHIRAWHPKAVLLLVGDEGLLRRQARWFRHGTHLPGHPRRALADLRDTLRAMRDVT